jgi:hypothetical protein
LKDKRKKEKRKEREMRAERDTRNKRKIETKGERQTDCDDQRRRVSEEKDGKVNSRREN